MDISLVTTFEEDIRYFISSIEKSIYVKYTTIDRLIGFLLQFVTLSGGVLTHDHQ